VTNQDHVEDHDDGSNVNNVAERFGRIQQLYNQFMTLAGNDQLRRATIDVLAEEINLLQESDDVNTADALVVFKDLLAAAANPNNLKAALQRLARDNSQSVVADFSRAAIAHLQLKLGGNSVLVTDAAAAVFQLTQERYAQDQAGRTYQSPAEQKRLQDAKARSAQVNVL